MAEKKDKKENKKKNYDKDKTIEKKDNSDKKENKPKDKEKKDSNKEYTEYYNIKNKEGEEKTIKSKGENKEEHIKKKKQEDYNRILRNFLIIIGIFFLIVIGIIIYPNLNETFEYHGIEFEKMEQGELQLYHAYMPVVLDEENIDYHLYLRNDPRKLEKEIPFNGELNLKKIIIFNSTKDLSCEGYGQVGLSNMIHFYKMMDAKPMKSENASCGGEEYVFIQMQSSNKTNVNQTGEYCYEINVKDCEVIKATERFIVEGIKEIKIN